MIVQHWRYTHNFVHHKYTNILGMEDDVGYGMLRVTCDLSAGSATTSSTWWNTILAIGFRVGSCAQHLRSARSSMSADCEAAKNPVA